MACYVSCLDSYHILLILITNTKRVCEKDKYTLFYWIPASNFVDFIVSKTHESFARSSASFFHSLELLPLDYACSKILVHSQNLDVLDNPIPDPR